MGPGQRSLREHVQRRQSNMAQRMRQHVDESLGSTVNPHQQAANLTEQEREAAAPLYREAYQHPVDMPPNLAESADSTVGPDAITAGARQIAQTPAAPRNTGPKPPLRPHPQRD